MQIDNLIIVSDFGFVNGGNSKVAIQTALAIKKKKKNVYFFCGAGPIDSVLFSECNKITCLNQKDIFEKNNLIAGSICGIWNRKAKKEFYNQYNGLEKQKTVVHFHSWSRVLSASVIYMAAKMGFRVFFTVHDYNLFCPNGSLYIFPKNEICHCMPLTYKCILCNCDRRKYIHKLYRIARYLCQRYVLKRIQTSYLITISKRNDELCRLYADKSAYIRMIKNPTDTFIPERVKVEKNQTFIFIGRISDEKGIRLFCEAVTRGGYYGIVLGNGYLLEELQRKYQTISFKGWCTKGEVIKYIQRARALVFPSLWYEGAPLVIMEMMQYGIPCIVSDVSSAVEEIENGKNGYIFESNNVDELMLVMEKVIKSKNLQQISTNAQNYFLQCRVSMEMYADELMKFYML